MVGAAGHAAGQARRDHSTEAVLPPDAEAARPLPPLDQMDTFLRALLGTLSSSPELARWLTTDDLIRQMANGIDRIANGASPASELAVLQPKGAFAASSGAARSRWIRRAIDRYDGWPRSSPRSTRTRWPRRTAPSGRGSTKRTGIWAAREAGIDTAVAAALRPLDRDARHRAIHASGARAGRDAMPSPTRRSNSSRRPRNS